MFRDGKILWANEEAHRLLSRPAGALIGIRLDERLMSDKGTQAVHDIPVEVTSAVYVDNVELRSLDASSLWVDMQIERVDDWCVLCTFTKQADGSEVRFPDAGEVLEAQHARQFRERIRSGLVRNEFLLVYQPKVDMPSGTVLGVEALIRWQHPERGFLLPASFIPSIEDHELVERLGDWVIGEAMQQAAIWRAEGLQTAISVNISPRHLLRPDFVSRLACHLNHFPQLPTGVLELEILETTAIKDFDAVANFIRACSELGVPVTLDDFGTGYSSLTYLRRLPVTALKLDQSFVRGMLDDHEDQAIVRGILVMAHGLGLKAIAEGVESKAHGDALMMLGCTMGQGYGIAKPLPADKIPEWIANFERDPPWGRREGV